MSTVYSVIFYTDPMKYSLSEPPCTRKASSTNNISCHVRSKHGLLSISAFYYFKLFLRELTFAFATLFRISFLFRV